MEYKFDFLFSKHIGLYHQVNSKCFFVNNNIIITSGENSNFLVVFAVKSGKSIETLYFLFY